jgi:hypothetical protein
MMKLNELLHVEFISDFIGHAMTAFQKVKMYLNGK